MPSLDESIASGAAPLVAILRGVQPDGPFAFDGAAYLAANQDVAEAGVDPLQHYLRHGHLERRRVKP